MNDAAFVAYKLLSAFVLPLGAVAAMLGAAVIASACHRPRLGFGLMAGAFSWLWLWSTPVVADALRASLEAGFPFRAASDYPEADAIVMLGGGIRGAPRDGSGMPDLNAAADREWFAAQLFHAGKAPRVLVSAGAGHDRQFAPGATGSATFLAGLGVPPEAVVLESAARNTLENALLVEEKLQELGAKRILLVTSAYHMPRALRLFAGTSAIVIPAPADHEAASAPLALWSLIPSAGALNKSTDALKEYVGLWGAAAQKALYQHRKQGIPVAR